MSGSGQNADSTTGGPDHSDLSPSATAVAPSVPEKVSRMRRWAGDFSGAFADLGTFLPLILGVFAVQQLDPTGVLIGFGIFALAVALIYRRPVPVQPMKAVAAIVVAGGLNAPGVAAAGLLLGVVLSVLGITGVVSRLARFIPKSVLTGVQLGIGLYLAWVGTGLVLQDPVLGVVALAALVLLQRTAFQPFSALIVLACAALWGSLVTGTPLPSLSFGISLPQLHLPDLGSLWIATQSIFLPQLALTVTNAAMVTAAIAADFFPQDRERITPDRLALTSGALNIVLAPLGAFPMCHGAGGLVVQHKFGARTGLAPALFGITCLVLAALLGADALVLMSVLPLAAVGALLVIAGADLALSKRLRQARPDCLIVILLTGLTCVTINVAVGLLIGLLVEFMRWLVTSRHSQA